MSWPGLARGLFDLAALGTFGPLLVAGWLLPGSGQEARRRALLRVAGHWAVAWLAATAFLAIATTGEVTGRSAGEVLRSASVLLVGLGTPLGRALLLVALGAFAVRLWAGARLSSVQVRALSAVPPLVLIPVLGAGHSATASHHFLAGVSVLWHVLAILAWVGGLLALTLHLRGDRPALTAALPRYSRVAGVCLVVIALSGVLAAWVRLGPGDRLWTSAYGAVILAKAALLAGLALIGAWQRRRILPALVTRGGGRFARWAGFELALMGVAVGMAVWLSRTAPPTSAEAAAPHAAPYPTVDVTLDPLGVRGLLLGYVASPALVTLTLVLVGTAAYAVTRRGLSTPDWRLLHRALFVTGLGTVAWALTGGLAAYAPAALSAQVAQFGALALVGPALIVAGLPRPLVDLVETWSVRDATLVSRRAWRPSSTSETRGLRSERSECLETNAMRPLNALLLLAALAVGSFRGPLLEWALPSVAGHAALSAAWLGCGLLAAASLRTAAPASEVVAGIATLTGVLALVAWQFGTAEPAAGGWYRVVLWWWSDPAADQATATAIAAASAGLTALAVLVAVPRRSPKGFPRSAVEADPAGSAGSHQLWGAHR